MSLNCYYLMSSLPSLTFEKVPPMSSKALLDRCRGQLSPAEMKQVELAGEGGGTHIILQRWREWDAGLRNTLAGLRAQKLGWQGREHVRNLPTANTSFTWLSAAIEAQNPMEAEQILDRARWRFLNDLEAGDRFSLVGVLIYRLKLQLLERWVRFDQAKGEAILADIMNRE